MNAQSGSGKAATASRAMTAADIEMLTPKEAAELLKVSGSFLAKARMSGDGPPFIKIGRAVRYSDAALKDWIKKQQRQSTSEQ